ncbi:MAG TPA: HlyD family secretion protein [Candidatus Acidoferrales bacterium]|nr:HlyD family secretion protein [Candidatus Acidoferrales bacterium]
MSEEKSAPPPAKNGGGRSNFSRPKLVVPGAIVLAVVLYFGIQYVVGIFTHESTDDAFIAGHITAVAPRIAGQVSAVYVNDNELVHSNELLVEIDPADNALTVAQKVAAADSQNANYRTMFAGYQLMQTKVATAEAAARKSEADAEAARASAQIDQTNYERAVDLLKQKTVSQQEFDNTQAANTRAQADLKSALESVEEDDSKVEEAERTMTAAREEAAMALAQWTEAQTNIAVAKLNLSYTKILAPTDGRVTRKAVEVGDYLQVGQQIMSIVPAEVWVVANFKESQLKQMRTNQPALVAIDALGGREFKAHVDSVQAGSGAQFSLLPPENATGNYVKVIQRVPVKIVFDEPLPADHVIGPGLSVTPEVAVSQFVLPDWARLLLAFALAGVSASIVIAVGGRKAGEA